jgi:hypothetical protein
MTAAEWWCLFAVIAAGLSVVLSVVLALRLPSGVPSFAAEASRALLGAAVGCLSVAALIVF